jgi:hypothetical protein
MSLPDMIRRLYRRILYEDKMYLSDLANEDEILKWVTKFFATTKGKGKIVYYPANTFSVDDLRAELLRLELAEQFVPNVILLDHLDLLTTNLKSIRQRENYSFWRLLVDDLRGISLDKHIAVVTATQGNRESSKHTLLTERDIGESYGKVQSSDVVIGINQTAEEYGNKRMRLGILKNRDYMKGQEIELHADLDKMLLCDLKFAQHNGWL